MIDPGHYPRLIGARLRELRVARGLSQIELSRQMGVVQQNVNHQELRGTCSLRVLARYAKALNVDITDILSCLQSPPSVATSAPFAATGGISGTSQPGRVSSFPGLAAAGHLTLDAPFGRADVRVAAERFLALFEPQTDVQAPVDVVGASAACSDSHGSEAINHGIAPVAVDLAAWSPCS